MGVLRCVRSCLGISFAKNARSCRSSNFPGWGTVHLCGPCTLLPNLGCMQLFGSAYGFVNRPEFINDLCYCGPILGAINEYGSNQCLYVINQAFPPRGYCAGSQRLPVRALDGCGQTQPVQKGSMPE